MRPTVMGWGAIQNWITERRFVVDKNIQFPRIGAQCRNCAAVRPSPLPQPRRRPPTPWLLGPEFAPPFLGSSGLMFPVSATRWQSLGAEAAARGLGQIRVSVRSWGEGPPDKRLSLRLQTQLGTCSRR